jgi:hypothetical protein
MGLDYLNRASSLRPDYMEAISYINLMYREKAKTAAMVGDNEGAAKWNQEADKYMHQALDLRRKQMAEQAKK